LKHHGSTLYLALGVTAVPARGFKRGEFKMYWDGMHRDIGRAKQQRYQELDGDLYARVFERQAHGGNREKACGVCGLEDESVPQAQDAEKICALCQSFIEWGGRLTRSDFVALGFSAPQDTTKRDASNALRAFGMQVEFAEARDKTIEFKTKPERAVVWALDDLKDGQTFPTVQDVPTANMTRYTVNRIPPFTFDELQEKSDGIPRLGVLRMDVDNLGDLFSKGFGEDEKNLATLARISTLSFQLGLFFEGWVKKICAEPEYESRVYAVYAGGDDVFLIAPWSIVPDLARRIVQDLNDYTAHNSDVHLSAGMTFIHGKYPVYQAAEDAHDALEQAKHLDEGKNAFCYLGHVWKWSEFENVRAKFERLEKLVRAKNDKDENGEEGLGAPEALLQTLRQFAQLEEKEAKGKTKPVWGKWMWLGAYKLTRDAERAREPKLKKELENLRDELDINKYSEIAQWGAAARWVQLFLRAKTND
jgi:CRISPR-associated protein Csm1